MTALESLFRDILQRLTDIYDYMRAPIPDRRIWKPDETCSPFLVEAMGLTSPATNGVFITFTVPQNCRAVIQRAVTCCGVGGTGNSKTSANVRIFPGNQNPGVAVDPASVNSLPLHGSLGEVRELVGAVNVPGLIAPSDKLDRECRIVLDPGPWTVWSGGSQPTTNNTYVSLFGWTFPYRPKTRG